MVYQLRCSCNGEEIYKLSRMVLPHASVEYSLKCRKCCELYNIVANTVFLEHYCNFRLALYRPMPAKVTSSHGTNVFCLCAVLKYSDIYRTEDIPMKARLLQYILLYSRRNLGMKIDDVFESAY